MTRWRKNGLVGFGHPAPEFSTRGEAFGADGAAALYRRVALEDCAPDGREVLDEDLELWASDVDLAWRARLLGWRCAYEPTALAEHVRSYSPATRAHMSPAARRLQFRNRYLMMAKNETSNGLLRDGLLIAGYELLALGHVVLRERHLLGGYRDAWRLLPGARRRRRLIQARRRVASPPFGLRPARRDLSGPHPAAVAEAEGVRIHLPGGRRGPIPGPVRRPGGGAPGVLRCREQPVEVVDIHERGPIADDLPDGRDIAGHHRRPAGQGLDRCEAEPLLVARHDQGVRARVDGRQLVV